MFVELCIKCVPFQKGCHGEVGGEEGKRYDHKRVESYPRFKTPPDIISNWLRDAALCGTVWSNRRITHFCHLAQYHTSLVFEVPSTKN
jgi:hypothetical protein